MGDPRKQRSKSSGPSHPWQKSRIDEEKVTRREYGFRRNGEIWKMNSLLRNFRTQAKGIIAKRTEQAEKEKLLLIAKLKSLGLLGETSTIDSVLGLKLKDLLERRLQTMVFRKGLARTMRQARQMIIHEHISVGDNKLTNPSYIVPVSEEGTIKYSLDSQFNNELHPERVQPEKIKVPEKKSDKKKEGEGDITDNFKELPEEE